MSHLSHDPACADTFIGPVLFADGMDRRATARIPLASRVRIGPPNGLPTSVVSASDLSVGGLFIDADREVRVGARFSVEVPLDDGSRVYVAEAEVAYNRERPSSSGFGVRFVTIDVDAAHLIANAIEKVTGFTTDVIDRPRKKPKAERTGLSALPTIVPAPLTDFSDLPEPSVLHESVVLDAELDLAEERRPATPGWWTRTSARTTDALHDVHLAVIERLRRAPRIAQGIAFIGAAALTTALAITLWSGGDAKAVEPKNTDGPNVPASTHQVLMGQAPIDALEAPSDEPVLVKPSSAKKRVTLPPLVRLDEPKPEVAKAEPAKSEVAKAEPAKLQPSKATPAKPEPSKPEPAKAEPAKEALAKAQDAPEAEAPKAKFSTAAQAILGGSEDRVKIPLAPGARVLKTHVFSNPTRYVIDVTDQPCPIAAPAPTGAVTRIRSGRHPEYCRIVMDLDQPLDAGRWSMAGDTLVVTLTY